VAAIEHASGRRVETMSWPDRGEKPAVRTMKPGVDSAPKRVAKLWARTKESKAGSRTWMWWRDQSRIDDGRVGAAAVCLNGVSWMVFRTYLGMQQMEVFDFELWVVQVELQKSIARAETLRADGLWTVARFREPQPAMRLTSHLDRGPGQHLARAMND
jgi:hypothetical protein